MHMTMLDLRDVFGLYEVGAENCQLAEKGQYHNPSEGKMYRKVWEGWCNCPLYIWSWIAGRAGTENDTRVLPVSPFIRDMTNDTSSFFIPSV